MNDASHRSRPTGRFGVRVASLLALGLLAALPAASPQAPPSDPARVRIDMRHILEGRVNRRGALVGLHHEPSAPRTMNLRGTTCHVRFEPSSPGGRDDVRTARVRLRDPSTGRVLLEKFSTLYPDSWDRHRIEQAIRDAYADARRRNRIDDDGRWEGRTRDGIRIDGFLSDDGTFIASAFPVYTPPPTPRGRR